MHIYNRLYHIYIYYFILFYIEAQHAPNLIEGNVSPQPESLGWCGMRFSYKPLNNEGKYHHHNPVLFEWCGWYSSVTSEEIWEEPHTQSKQREGRIATPVLSIVVKSESPPTSRNYISVPLHLEERRSPPPPYDSASVRISADERN